MPGTSSGKRRQRSTPRSSSTRSLAPGHDGAQAMSDTLTYQQMGTADRSQAHVLFAQTMGYVAATAGLFALGAWAGHHLSGGVGIFFFIAAFACLLGMRFAAKRSLQLTVGLLAAFGLLLGLAVAPTVAYYATTDPQVLWQAGGATALFIAGFGAAGYANRRDLSALARGSVWALVALQRQRFRAAAGRCDLPRRAQRVPVLPADLRPQQLAAGGGFARGGVDG